MTSSHRPTPSLPKAILIPLSPRPPQALGGGGWGGGAQGRDGNPPASARGSLLDREASPERTRLTAGAAPCVLGENVEQGRGGEECGPGPCDHPSHPAAPAGTAGAITLSHRTRGYRIQVSHLRRMHTLPTLCPRQACLRTGIHRYRSTHDGNPGQSWVLASHCIPSNSLVAENCAE